MLLFRRWREADQARVEAETALRERLTGGGQAEAAARAAGTAARRRRTTPCRRGARKRRLRRRCCSGCRCSATAGRSGTRRRAALIETLRGRIAQLARDIEREAGLNRDAGETIARLDWEIRSRSPAPMTGTTRGWPRRWSGARGGGDPVGARGAR